MAFSLARKQLIQERKKTLDAYCKMYDETIHKERALSLIQGITKVQYAEYAQKYLEDEFKGIIQKYTNDYNIELKQKYLNSKTSFLLNSYTYGTVDDKFFNEAMSLTPKKRKIILKYFYEFVYKHKEGYKDAYIEVNKGNSILPKMEDLMKVMWNYVFDTKFDIVQIDLKSYDVFFSEYDNHFYAVKTILEEISNKLDKRILEEMYIAEYVMKCIRGGNEIVVQELSGYNAFYVSKIGSSMEKFASILNYIKNEDGEQQVLQAMVSNHITMSNELYDRYNYLCNRSKDAPKTYEIKEEREQIHFDVSSVEWREDDINKFFKELKLLKKKLTYSLALRSEDEMLMIPKNVAIPGLEKVCQHLNHDFEEEFEDEVKASIEVATIVSNEINESIEGLLVSVKEIPYLNVFIHMMKIGKKLNIKYYTIFNHQGLELEEQNKKVLILSKNLSPSASVWEKSIKETILYSLQHVLNSNASLSGQDKKEDKEEF